MKSNIKYHQKLNIFIKKAVVIFVITFSFLSVVACKSSEPESLDDEVLKQLDDSLSSSCFNTSSSSGNYSWDNNSLVAFRLLTQATFGPTASEIARVKSIGETAWIEEQLNSSSVYDQSNNNLTTNLECYKLIAKMAEPSVYSDDTSFNNNFHGRTSDYQMAAWFEKALHAPDQLRYRVAFALSELFVVSGRKQRTRFRGDSLAYYDDILAKNAFGNFRDILQEVTMSPAMGIFLSHQGNKKYLESSKTHPDENYAREAMQLFSIGLWQMHDNGTAKMVDNKSQAAYTQEDVEQFARVLTGYDLTGNSRYGKTHRGDGEEWSTPMEFTNIYHDFDNKTFLGQSIASETDNGLNPLDLKKSLDIIFENKNVASHFARHLIMRLVTSNPSPGYIERVAKKFNDNGVGVRGDLKVVVRAVLTDNEARGDEYQTNKNYGKVKEPLLAWTQFLRAFDVKPLDGWKSRSDASMNNVYNFPWLETIIGQAPLRSDSVFNFFSPDFVPADSHFNNNSMVAPELQIQSDTILIKFNNLVTNSLWIQEKNRIIDKGDTITGFGKSRKHTQNNFYINVDEDLDVFEQALDGDKNGDFAGLADNNNPKKGDAIDALLNHFDLKLTGGNLPSSYFDVIKTHLLDVKFGNQNNKREALAIIRDAIMLIVTSSSFMIQK